MKKVIFIITIVIATIAILMVTGAISVSMENDWIVKIDLETTAIVFFILSLELLFAKLLWREK